MGTVMWLRDRIGSQERGRRSELLIGKVLLTRQIRLDLELHDFCMEVRTLSKFGTKTKPIVTAVVIVMLVGGLMTFAFAQSNVGSSFNLNSPAAFPVDI